MNVAAVIVTRGDQDITPVWMKFPTSWDVVIWDNSKEEVDLAVYGRYAAIERTEAELIYVQDDDCVVSNPQAIVDAWHGRIHPNIEMAFDGSHVVCNMPPEFRHEFYEEHALVGFGACFHRDAPGRAFARFAEALPMEDLRRTCDIVFTALTPRVLVDVPKEDMPWAHYENRMWKQPGHQAERVRMLDMVRAIA